MGIASTTELGRVGEAEIGKFTTLKRRWVCVLTDDTLANSPTSESAILSATGTGSWGAAHPTFADFKLRKVKLTEGYEGSPYHVLVEADYSVIRPDELLHPTSRTAEWSAEATQGEYPALFYYDGSGTKRPLTNSAYDYFPGLTTSESIVRVQVKKNFASWPTAWFGANNYVNSASYFGCPTHTLRVNGITASLVYEDYNNTVVSYYASTATLLYRESGHNLQLPDIGWNFLAGGQKRRAMVFDFENGEWVASPNPVGLDGSGGQTLGAPAVLNRRVFPETSFSAIFGSTP
jgi:hypothetical protein